MSAGVTGIELSKVVQSPSWPDAFKTRIAGRAGDFRTAEALSQTGHLDP